MFKPNIKRDKARRSKKYVCHCDRCTNCKHHFNTKRLLSANEKMKEYARVAQRKSAIPN